MFLGLYVGKQAYNDFLLWGKKHGYYVSPCRNDLWQEFLYGDPWEIYGDEKLLSYFPAIPMELIKWSEE